MLVISQTFTYGAGTFHTYCGVSGESAAKSTREHHVCAVKPSDVTCHVCSGHLRHLDFVVKPHMLYEASICIL